MQCTSARWIICIRSWFIGERDSNDDTSLSKLPDVISITNFICALLLTSICHIHKRNIQICVNWESNEIKLFCCLNMKMIYVYLLFISSVLYCILINIKRNNLKITKGRKSHFQFNLDLIQRLLYKTKK